MFKQLFGTKKQKVESKFNYENQQDKLAYRYGKLKEIIGNNKFVMSIETNLTSTDVDGNKILKELNKQLDQQQIPHFLMSTISNQHRSVFGIGMNGKGNRKSTAYILVMELTKEQLTENLFYQHLSYSDLIIGLEPKLSFEDLQIKLEEDYDLSFVNSDDFENYVYDSNNFHVIRTSKQG